MRSAFFEKYDNISLNSVSFFRCIMRLYNNILKEKIMRDPIEDISRLQTQLNDLQLENQILKNILDNSGISYR